MRHSFLLPWLLVHLSCLSQNLITSHTIDSKVTDAKSFAIQDTILISYRETRFINNSEARILQCMLVSKDGKATKAVYNESLFNNLIAIIRDDNNSNVFYNLSGKDKTPVVTSTVVKSLNALRSFGRPVESILEGELVNFLTIKNHLHAITYKSKTSELVLTKLNASGIAGKEVYKLPFDLSDYFKFGVQVNELPIASGIFTSMAKVKLFIAPEQITITVDCGYGCKGPGNHTKFITMDRRSKKIVSYFEKETTKLNFVSGFLDGKLFRFLPRAKDWELQVIDGSTGDVSAIHVLAKSDVQDDAVAFQNDGKNFNLSNDISFRSMMNESNGGLPALTVTSLKSRGYLIRWGTFREIPGFGQFLLAGNSLPSAIPLFLITDRWIVTPGIVSYSYLHFDPLTNQFQPFFSNPGISGKIEDYEINLKNESVNYINYALFNDGIIATYLIKKKADHEIRLVHFEGSDHERR